MMTKQTGFSFSTAFSGEFIWRSGKDGYGYREIDRKTRLIHPG